MESWKPAAHAVGIEGEALQKRSAFHYCYIVSFLMLTQGVKCKRGQRGKPNCVHFTGCYWASGLAVTCGFILFSPLCHFSRVTWGGGEELKPPHPEQRSFSSAVVVSYCHRPLCHAVYFLMARVRGGGDSTGGCRNVTPPLEWLAAGQHRVGALS